MNVSRKALSISLIAFTAVALLAALLMMPYAFDDFVYMEFLRVTVDGIPSPIDWEHFYDMWAWRYMNDNIRLANMACVFSFYLPKWVPDLVAAGLFAASIGFAMRLARIELRRPGAVGLLCLLLSVGPAWYDLILSLDFYLNYIYPTAMALAAVWVAIRRQRFNCFGALCLGGILGGWHEAFGLTVFCTIIGLMVVHRRLRRRHVVWLMAGLALGTAFLLKARGIGARWADRGDAFEVQQFMERMVAAWPGLLYLLLQSVGALRRRWRFMGDVRRQALWLMALGGSLFMLASPAPRATWFGQVVGCIGLAAMAAQWRLPGRVRRVGAIAAAALLVARWAVALPVCHGVIAEYQQVMDARRCNVDTVAFLPITEYPQQPLAALGLPGKTPLNYLSGYEYYHIRPEANFRFVAEPLRHYRYGLGRQLPSGGVWEYEHALVAPAPAGITADSRMHTCAVEIDSPLLDGYRSEAMLMPFRGADGRDYVYIYIDYYPIYVHTVGDLRITGDFKEQEHM